MTRKQTGWSLIEGMVTLAVIAVALGAAVPGFDSVRERRHVEGAAAQLETDLQLARSVAVMQSRTVRVSFQADAAGSCYVVHSGEAGACRCDAQGHTSCTGDAQALRSTGYPADLPVRLASNAASMAFEHARGTVTPTSTVRVTGPGQAVHVVTNIMGRVRSCAPGGVTPGYPRC